MSILDVLKSYNRDDKIIAFSVMSQPLLVVLQFLMISVFFMPEEQTTKYRVVLTAFPMIISIIIGFKKKPRAFIFTFFFLFLFLLFEYLLFPDNGSYILSDALRFLVPIIVPSMICLSCLKDINIIEDVFYFYSWIIVGMMLFFAIRFLQGSVDFTSYNMGLSYALLLPMVTLYKKGGILSYLAVFVCFMSIMVFGSRGPLVAGVLYILYDIVNKNKKNIVLIIIVFSFLSGVFISLSDYLESLGISSRTLSMIIGGGLSSAEGRDDIYARALEIIRDNWFMGIGIYGDRIRMEEYCHNIILELWLNYGVILGSILILVSFFYLVNLYRGLNREHKNSLVKFFIVLFLPLFVSGSYLTDCSFGVFWGIAFLLNNCKKKKRRRFNLNNSALVNTK